MEFGVCVFVCTALLWMSFGCMLCDVCLRVCNVYVLGGMCVSLC